MNKLRNLNGLSIVKVLIYVFFGLFMLLPLFSVFLVSFTGEPVNLLGSLINSEIRNATIDKLSNISFDNYKEIFNNASYLEALKNSLLLAFGVTIIITLMCIPMAYGLARTTMPFKKTITALCTFPLIIPTFISATAFIIMFGRAGWITQLYNKLGFEGMLIDPSSMRGIILVQVFFFFPYALWPLVAAFKISDISLEEASQNLGAKSWLTFIFVTFPMALPGIISSALLIFTVSFSDFGTPIVLAPKGLNLLVVEAYREMTGFFNWGGAAILSDLIAVSAIALS